MHIASCCASLHIYTDGSKSDDGRVGCAFHVPSQKISKNYRLTDNASVYTSELMAINLCLKWASTQADRDIAIFSDSLSALKSIQELHSNSRPNLLFEVLTLLRLFHHNGRSVKLIWIPSHVGLLGNEVVDQAAKDALSKVNFDYHVELETSEVINFVNARIIKQWQTHWNDSSTGSFYRNIEPEISSAIKFQAQPRRKETCITRLRLGKCYLKHYLFTIGCHTDGLC